MTNWLEKLEQIKERTINNFLWKDSEEILKTIDHIIAKAGHDRDNEHKNHFKENYSKFLEKIQKTKDPDMLKKMYIILDNIKNKIPLNHDQAILLHQYDLKNREDVSLMDNIVFDSNYRWCYLPAMKEKIFNINGENNVFYGSVYDNTFWSKITNNTFSDEVLHNHFDNLVIHNKFSNKVRHNRFNNLVQGNTFSAAVEGNYFLEETAQEVWKWNIFQDSGMDFQQFERGNIFKDKKTFW